MKVSVVIGIAGGLVDLVSGSVLLADASSRGSLMEMMGPSSSTWGGLFLLALGIVVLVTTLLMMGEWGRRVPAAFRLLMFVYGIAMLGVGASMIAQLFSMTSGSLLSGAAMIVIGAAMIVSASSMGDAMGRAMPLRP